MMGWSVIKVAVVVAAVATGVAVADTAEAQLVISEFRVRGPNGANDEFVEIFNAASTPHTVASTDGSSGYALAASTGGARFVIPNGTVIPAHGHFLGVNSIAYSTSAYPAGGTATATGDVTYATDIADNAGIALFSTSNAANFSTTTRMDAVGSAAEANTLYREGTGYPTLTPFSIDYAWYRDLAAGNPKDTDNNASDFLFVDTNGTSAGGGQRLGAPGPEKSIGPLGDSGLAVGLLDPSVSATSAPNLVRDLTSNPAQNSTFGTVTVRRTITNSTTAPLTALRFRISELTTFPASSGTADLRPLTSSSTTATVNGVATTVLGTTLEQPPSQPNGGGFNSSMGVTLASPLEVGASVSVQLLFGIQQTGKFRVCGNLESLPSAGGALGQVGNTDTGPTPAGCQRTQPPPPFNLAAPTVTSSGQPKQGQALSSSIGTWSGSGVIVYGTQWRRCDTTCADIANAIKDTYTPDASDVGKTLRVRVIAANVGGLVGAESASTAAVVEGTAPALTASTDGAVKGGVLNVTLTCPSTETSCAGTVHLAAVVKGASVDLGSASYSMLGGNSQTLAIGLTKRGRALTRKRKLSATMTVEATDAAGNSTTFEQTVTLKKSRK